MATDGKQTTLSSGRPADDRSRTQKLGLAIESEIIPTLLKQLANDIAPPPEQTCDSAAQMSWVESVAYYQNRQQTTTHTSAIAPSSYWLDPNEFATLVLADNEDSCKQHFERLRTAGLDDKSLLLDLLAPTSVELGRRWETDLIGFADVTIGVCRLHQLLRSLHPQSARELDNSAHGGRVLLTTAPGEQHSFGLLMVGELLFRGGWYTDIDIDAKSAQIQQKVTRQWYEVVGISISGETCIDGTRQMISALRKCSCNPDIAIITGGSLINTQPELHVSLGADQAITAEDDLCQAVARYTPTTRRI